MKNLWIKVNILLITMVLVSSSIAIADINNLETKKSSNTNSIITRDIIIQNVGPIAEYIIWDNDMDLDDLVAAIKPQNPLNIDVYPADDFQLENNAYISGVNWIGGFLEPNPQSWDWCIDIYLDDGTGEMPGEEISESFCFSWEEINKEEITESVWKMGVELPYTILLTTGKYWISIYAIGDSPPTAGWGYHLDTIKLHQAVFKSDFYGYLTWTLVEKIIDNPADLCFQLISTGNYSIDVEKQVMDKNGEWQDCDTENEALDVKICNDITFRIVIENDGDFPLNDIAVYDLMEDGLSYVNANPEPDNYSYDPPYHYILWNILEEFLPGEKIVIEITAHVDGPDCSIDSNYVKIEAEDEYGSIFSDEDYCYVHAVKKSKTLNLPFLNWLQSHPKLFQLLQFLLHRIEI